MLVVHQVFICSQWALSKPHCLTKHEPSAIYVGGVRMSLHCELEFQIWAILVKTENGTKL